TYNTAESVELSREAARLGVDGILGTVPYYNNPPQEGLFQHFRAIASAVDLPMILYNIPSRSPRNMEAATTLRLAREVSNIIGVKEASANFKQIGEIIRDAPDGFRVWSGNDADILKIMALGGYGVVPGAASPATQSSASSAAFQRHTCQKKTLEHDVQYLCRQDYRGFVRVVLVHGRHATRPHQVDVIHTQ